MRGVPNILIVLLLAQAVSAFPFDSGGTNWTITCSDGSALSGGSPFVGDVGAGIGATCTLAFRVAEGMALAVGKSAQESRTSVFRKLPATHQPIEHSLKDLKEDDLKEDDHLKKHELKGQDMKEPRQSRRLTGSTSEIAVSSGNFPSEVSWTVACPSGSSASGGAPFSGSLSATGGEICTLAMADSFGDGWNGASWTGFEQSFMISDGESVVETFQIPFPTPSSPPSPPAPPLPHSPPVLPPLSPPPHTLPAPLLPPPLRLLPDGFQVVGAASDIRAALRYPHARVCFHLPEGFRFGLGGAQVAVHQSNVTIRSDGVGATIDAEGLSRHFDVAKGAQLHLENLRLVNGGFEMSGGSILVRNGGTLTTSNVHISNSRAFSTLTAVCVAFTLPFLSAHLEHT